eukprot:TRINITY_DN33872_c0_g1_i1.p1 TRINITY_DN33872_c0_g1~~TRINITY_DN33872_c0_g1_i1.p1  ORF type:complete len:362 (-),score=58.96 TRINITY_DN33872_c0_g1_i1:351-1436(-)
MCPRTVTLRSAVRDGFLSDVLEVQLADLKRPEALQAWHDHPYKLYKSAAATKALKCHLDSLVPGLQATYMEVLTAIMKYKDNSFCFLIGGQVRDILQGKISKDTDFNYACSAQDVAMVCIQNKWMVKYKAIGPVSEPNYVLIGDEQTDAYMEGFPLSFNATDQCFKGDFRQNMLFYDLANDVILDKSGHGISDIRDRSLRVACAPYRHFDDWVASDISFGLKALRYVKFLVRSRMDGSPMSTDKTECSFIVDTISKAFKDNAPALHCPWFGIAFDSTLSTKKGVDALHAWVLEQGGPSWWLEWMPFVRPKVKDPSWLEDLPASPPLQCRLTTKLHTTDATKRKKRKRAKGSEHGVKRARPS